MRKALLTRLQCPDCSSPGSIVLHSEEISTAETITKGVLSCERCSEKFPVVDDIAVLLPRNLRYHPESEILRKVDWVPTLAEHEERFFKARFNEGNLARPVIQTNGHQPQSWLTQQKLNQRDYGDIPWDKPYTRPFDRGQLFRYMGYHAMGLAAKAYGQDLAPLQVLNVGCGHGFEAEYLANTCGVKKMVGTDISLNTLRGAERRARRYGYEMDLVCADVDHLPFKDNGFDLAVCHEALHHLPIPANSIVEMGRVAASLMIVNEPVENLIRNSLKLVSHIGRRDYEISGNFAYRFLPQDLAALCKYIGFEEVNVFRYFTRCPQEPPRYYSWFENPLLFWGLRQTLGAANAVFGKRMGFRAIWIARKQTKKAASTQAQS